ncbi:GvpL/GvpF family gas vesicle protein [Methylococcus sp. ANG]|uniref:GvpL/GvpF family gas vesicle protein n=1 Tax=Methylococcus sp. ANG TaxID=3231903 RepID=UPI003459318C
MSAALYLYCLTPQAAPEDLCLSEFPNLFGSVHWEACGEIGAVLSRIENVEGWVSDDLFADADWATHRALHHARVIELVWSKVPVYPAQFGTLYGSLDSLKSVLVREHASLDRFFRATAGMAEWDIKVFFNPSKAQDKWVQDRIDMERDVIGGLSGGKRYLVEQRLRRDAKYSVVSDYKTLCVRILEELTHDAAGVCGRALPPLEDSDKQPLGHWAALWPATFSSEIDERMEEARAEHRRLGIDVQWSGPWPPYSFRSMLTLD